MQPSSQLPNFLIIGGQKCGTTALHSTLSLHQQVFMSAEKEINFFTSHYSSGLDSYRKHFAAAEPHHLALGEASPGYICHPDAPQRILDSLGEVRLVILLRDPIKRAVSQYWDNRRHFGEKLTLSQAIDSYLEKSYDPSRPGYFSRGIYIDQIERYCHLFPRNKIHVIIFEELLASSKNELTKLYEFLEVRTDRAPVELKGEANRAMVYQNPLYSFLFKNPTLSYHLPKRMRRFAVFGPTQRFEYSLPVGKDLETLQHFYANSISRLEQFVGREVKWPLAKGSDLTSIIKSLIIWAVLVSSITAQALSGRKIRGGSIPISVASSTETENINTRRRRSVNSKRPKRAYRLPVATA